MALLEVLEDSTQNLVFYPPIAAQPTAATVRVQTPSTALPDSADSATVDSISVTTSSAASAGDTSLSVGSAAWVAGTLYVIEPTNAAAFVVECGKTSTGTTLYLQQPLPCAVASGSAVKGYKITHALTADETSDAGDSCLAIWRVTIGGVVYQWPQPFRIVRRFSHYTLNSATLLKLSPLVYAERAGTDEDLSETIDAAWIRILAPALKAKGVRLERVISRDELVPAHVAAVEYLLALQSRGNDAAAVQLAREEFNQALTLALQGNDTWIDDDEEEAAAQNDSQSQSFGTTRLGL